MLSISRREALHQLAAVGAAASTAVACKPPGEGQSTMATPVLAPAPVAAPVVDPVVRVLPLGMPWPTPDPFLFCVHHEDHYPASAGQFGPASEQLAGRDMGQDFGRKDGWSMYHGMQVPGFPSHPHRGFETVTVTRRGVVDHADSMGAAARYGDGDVQWLTAGRGIQHAEMFPLLHEDKPNPMELFQIWLNLPAADKMVAPYFKMLWGPTVPHLTMHDTAGRMTELAIVAGQLGTTRPPAPPPNSWASKPDTDVAIWTLKMAPGAQWTLPAAKPGTNRMLYFYRGQAMQMGPTAIPALRAVELKGSVDVVLSNGPDVAELLLLQGRPIGEPVAQFGPFVMNTQQQIQQAYADYQRTRFGGWPWPSSAPVHGSQGRFARQPDGTVERAG